MYRWSGDDGNCGFPCLTKDKWFEFIVCCRDWIVDHSGNGTNGSGKLCEAKIRDGSGIHTRYEEIDIGENTALLLHAAMIAFVHYGGTKGLLIQEKYLSRFGGDVHKAYDKFRIRFEREKACTPSTAFMGPSSIASLIELHLKRTRVSMAMVLQCLSDAGPMRGSFLEKIKLVEWAYLRAKVAAENRHVLLYQLDTVANVTRERSHHELTSPTNCGCSGRSERTKCNYNTCKCRKAGLDCDPTKCKCPPDCCLNVSKLPREQRPVLVRHDVIEIDMGGSDSPSDDDEGFEIISDPEDEDDGEVEIIVDIDDNGEIFPDNTDSNDDVDDENFYNTFGFQRSSAVEAQEEIADLDGDCVKSNGDDNDEQVFFMDCDELRDHITAACEGLDFSEQDVLSYQDILPTLGTPENFMWS